MNEEGIHIPISLIKLMRGYKEQNDILIKILKELKTQNTILLDEVKKLKFENFKVK